MILGAMLAIGLLLGRGSSYNLLSGSGLMLAGTLIAARKRAGAWVYMGVFAITLFWSLHGLQKGGSSLPVRLVGPTILLCMIALTMPALRGWRANRTIATFAAILTATIVLGISSTAGAPLARPSAAAGQFLVN